MTFPGRNALLTLCLVLLVALPAAFLRRPLLLPMHWARGAIQVQDDTATPGLLSGQCYPGTVKPGQLLQVIRLTKCLRLKAAQGVGAGDWLLDLSAFWTRMDS